MRAQKGAFLSMPAAIVQDAECFAIVPHGPFWLPVAVRAGLPPRAQPGGLPIGTQPGDLHREPALRLAGAREQRLHYLGQPCPDARRPGHLHRRGPAGELAVEDQEGQPAEMITVQVGHCHGIN